MFGSRSSAGGLELLLNRPTKSSWELFLDEPCVYVAEKLYHSRNIIPPQPPTASVTVICVSDTHNTKPELPPGEIIIHAGDATQSGTLEEFQATIDWLDSFPHRHKVLIAGNHDLLLDPKLLDHNPITKNLINWRSVIYLENETISLRCSGGRQIEVFGSPLTPKHGNWAFQYPRNRDVWHQVVPADTQILVTHGPPRGHLDLGSGCDFLLEELWRVRPQLHVFGHIHAAYGQEWVQFDNTQQAFEDVIKARGGIRRLLLLLYNMAAGLFGSSAGSPTLLVNASAVGGLRDEKRRDPIVVKL